MTTRITYNVFIKGILSQIVADHNRRGLSTIIEVDGKIEKQWDGLTLEQLAEISYTFYVQEQKFMIRWIIQPDDADAEDCFELQANGVPLVKLDYLNLDFKLVEKDVSVFDGEVEIN